jgi:hypothetical protein
LAQEKLKEGKQVTQVLSRTARHKPLPQKQKTTTTSRPETGKRKKKPKKPATELSLSHA